ncbi:hypothetical protein [Bradyrhizobium canariense]|uniref:Uncharacterized protein n=1 Tax=Bradyrhizobium canariense TaxID=255045 RepID=A0A1H1ZVW8_9BRAD|nr:hypothetical protein [Bradyrhizobium canariense]SDT37868.1 hypothetical protein SAMN05444158_5709 [Bradyrhizobium canariense]
MKAVMILGLAAVIPLGAISPARSEGTPAKVFACSIDKKMVSVTSDGGQLIYHYGTAGHDEMTIVGVPSAGNIFQMTQRYAGMEYQLRFKNGEFSYIVYEGEGNARVGAAGTSGLVVMQGGRRISDKSCARFTQLAMPDDALHIPADTDAYSAM